MLGGGTDREWLEPLDSEGNRQTSTNMGDQMVGCHVGNYAGLNITNPQPGFEYEWMINPANSRNAMSARIAINSIGAEIVNEGDPERAAYRDMDGMQNAALDTSTTFNDEVVLVRIPEERQRVRRDEIEQKNQRMLRRGPEESFVNSASALEQLQRYNQRGPTRFALGDHQTEFKHDGSTAEVSLPDSGIVSTEHTR